MRGVTQCFTPLKSPQGDTTQVGKIGVVLMMLVLMLFLSLFTPLKSPQGDNPQVGRIGVVLMMLVLMLFLLLLTPLIPIDFGTSSGQCTEIV